MGVAAVVSGLLLPWTEIDPEAYGWFDEVLAEVGLIPEAGRPVRGYEIPWRVREETSRAGVATAVVLDDIGSGRLDRAAARALFGERVEVEWAPVVLLPASLAVLHGLLLLVTGKRGRARILWAWLGLVDLLLTLAVGVIILRALDEDLGAPLRVLSGPWVTLVGLTALLVGSVRSSRP